MLNHHRHQGTTNEKVLWALFHPRQCGCQWDRTAIESKCWWGCRGRGPLVCPVGMEITMQNPQLKLKQTFDPALLLLDTTLKGCPSTDSDVNTLVLIVGFLKIVIWRSQIEMPINKWVKKTWYPVTQWNFMQPWGKEKPWHLQANGYS